jgi:ABC-type transporter MlaC component
METKVQEAWLDYISANKYKAEYYLIKYLKTLSKEQLADLLENFGREHSNVLMERK